VGRSNNLGREAAADCEDRRLLKCSCDKKENPKASGRECHDKIRVHTTERGRASSILRPESRMLIFLKKRIPFRGFSAPVDTTESSIVGILFSFFFQWKMGEFGCRRRGKFSRMTLRREGDSSWWMRLAEDKRGNRKP
jgi:hypothetical protein